MTNGIESSLWTRAWMTSWSIWRLAEQSWDGVLIEMGELRKCVAFLTDSGFDAPCEIEHPIAWMMAILWECGATNEQVKGMFDWTCRAVEKHEAATGAKMPPGDWGFCFCEVRRRPGDERFGDERSGNGRICARVCPTPGGIGGGVADTG